MQKSTLKLNENYGETQLLKIDNAHDFWCILDELKNNNINKDEGFWHNRTVITDALIKGNLFSVRIVENDFMYKHGAREDPIFSRMDNGELSLYLLPCFIVIEDSKVIMLWVHPRIRRKGIATFLVRETKCKSTFHKLSGSERFWESLSM